MTQETYKELSSNTTLLRLNTKLVVGEYEVNKAASGKTEGSRAFEL